VTFLDLKDSLVSLVDHWRGSLKRQLQHFLNMLLFPVVGYGRVRAIIDFDDSWLERREFTISVLPKEGRSFKQHLSTLRHLRQATDELIDSAAAIRDFVKSFKALTLAPRQEQLVLPYTQQVVEVA
jgi:hypothetical protein